MLSVIDCPGILIATPVTIVGTSVTRNTSQSPSCLNPNHIVDPAIKEELFAISKILLLLYAVAVTSSNRTYPAIGN